MEWKDKKEELEKFIADNKSYEELGRYYGVTGAAVKKACKRLGLSLPQRRKINPNETFNKKLRKTGKCLNCGKEFVINTSSTNKFCSIKCQHEHNFNEYIKRWQNGQESGLIGKYSISKYIRKYLFRKYEDKCQICGWDKKNIFTKKVPLQIHHIDGNCLNNKENNLQLLCPNCHSLTENFGSRNKNATLGRTEHFKKGC